MGGCFSWLLLLAGGVFAMATLLRWFEQATEAVERGWWNKVVILILMPFTVWFFPSRVSAGRPIAVPRHEPVRGFGKVSINPESKSPSPAPDVPPPGTPPEFIGLPKIPPKPSTKKPMADAEKIARLRQKMKEQGMLGDDS
jgi:hypothetical protein